MLFTKKLGTNLLDQGGQIYSSTVPIRATGDKPWSKGVAFLLNPNPVEVALKIFVNSFYDAPFLPERKSRNIRIIPKKTEPID